MRSAVEPRSFDFGFVVRCRAVRSFHRVKSFEAPTTQTINSTTTITTSTESKKMSSSFSPKDLIRVELENEQYSIV